MSQGPQSLHISGSKYSPDIQMDASASSALQHMKEQLLNYQLDNKKLSDQLNCLVSLIKRSWGGDKHATTHLSNIVGMVAPDYHIVARETQDGSIARPNSQAYKASPSAKSRCEQNWERLALKLLERDYQAVEEEIREYQQRYIENRQAYMDAVLQDHQQNMSRINLHRKTEVTPLNDIDNRFIKHNQALQRMGTSLRGTNRRVQSAGVRRQVRVQDRVERMEVSLRDLVVETPSSGHFATAQALNGPSSNIQPVSILRRPQSSNPTNLSQQQRQVNAYNDAGRYLQNDLFAVNENDGVKKPRPVSASSLREGDIARSRPRSGRPHVTIASENSSKPAFVTQRNERSLKYETTRPVLVKPKSAKQQRRNSTDGLSKRPPQHGRVTETQPTHADMLASPIRRVDIITSQLENDQSRMLQESNTIENEPHQLSQDFLDDDSEPMEASKPAVSVRVKSAFTRRPCFIDEFAKDEQAMRDMEADFKRTALNLQKKLGIDGSGFITF